MSRKEPWKDAQALGSMTNGMDPSDGSASPSSPPVRSMDPSHDLPAHPLDGTPVHAPRIPTPTQGR
eukprot:scaffold1639_cov331-Pavlova_lutheri.AAC.18